MQEEEDPWVQYDLLKQRLKRLRVRFYRQRAEDKNRLSGSRHIWKDRQNEVLNDLEFVRHGLRDLQGSSNEYHFCVSAENAGGLKTKRVRRFGKEFQGNKAIGELRRRTGK